MKEKSNKDLALRIELVQESIWKVEDYVIKNLGIVEKTKAEISELTHSLDLINEKLDQIEKELRGLRTNGTY